MSATRTDHLLELLAHAYDRPAWHGPNLREALTDVGLERALWRPAPERHNIWELALHCAFWKRVVIRGLEGRNDEEGLSGQPKDFPALPDATQENWVMALASLERTHRTLLERVAAFDEARLVETTAAGERTFAELIFGVANHDTYHAGQIRLLLVLHQDAV